MNLANVASIALDGLSLIPGGGEVADGARVIAGATTAFIGMLSGDVKGVAASAGGVAISSGGLFKEGMSKAVGEAIPIVGTVVGAYAVKHDIDNIRAEYNKCMAGD